MSTAHQAPYVAAFTGRDGKIHLSLPKPSLESATYYLEADVLGPGLVLATDAAGNVIPVRAITDDGDWIAYEPREETVTERDANGVPTIRFYP